MCRECGGEIPPTRALRARYCSERCYRLAGSKRWKAANRERVRQMDRKRARRKRRIKSYGFDPGDNPLAHTKDKYRIARALGYRSGLEVAVAKQLTDAGARFAYETLTMPFTPKPKLRRYTPDIVLENGLVIELKGRFVTADRQKHIAVQAAHPDIVVRFVFSNSRARISKQSNTTYALWCESHGFQFSDKSVPQSWIDEPPHKKSLAAIARLMEAKK